MSTSPIDILESSLLDSPLPYTVAAAAAKVNRKQQWWMDRKINRMKAAFRRPEIGDLKHELSTLDIGVFRVDLWALLLQKLLRLSAH
jgi:hypothetical protein